MVVCGLKRSQVDTHRYKIKTCSNILPKRSDIAKLCTVVLLHCGLDTCQIKLWFVQVNIGCSTVTSCIVRIINQHISLPQQMSTISL